MKELKIEIPQGYEIDKEKSTFEKIVFKKIKKELPKNWEDLKKIEGFYTESPSSINNTSCKTISQNRNVFATKEQAEASIALAQLSQLREVYRNGWVPDWSDEDEDKFCIEFYKGKIYCEYYINTGNFLSFQDAETRNLFLENFRDLIEQAKPLMS